MNIEKRFIIEIGQGVDQHGHNNDCTNAAVKAVKNATSNNCLCGLSEICGIKDPKDLLKMKVQVKIGSPYPETINREEILRAIPFGEKSIEVVKGGLVGKGVMIKALGDTSENIIVCDATVTVSVK
ncbi:MAG: Lin0512 family protein [Candidatus Thorarchaeota archaeon]